MPRLLIAYDGSESSRSAVRTAARLLPDSEAVVLHVDDLPYTPDGASVAEQGRAAAADAGLVADDAVTAARGPVWQAVVAEADGREADLIVCGTRGQGAVGRALLGSTSSSLVHQAERPLLIVPAGEHDVGGPLVLGYDGSEDARNAVAAVGRLLPGRETVVVHVWTWPLTDTVTERALLAAPMVRESGMVEALKEAAEQIAAQIAEEGRDLAEQHGLRARSEIREATEGTWRALVAAADDLSAAAILAGSRGQGGVRSALLGSVSTALAHRAERPTLIVRPVG